MNQHHRQTPAGKPRARSLGIPFDGTPGPYNAITDVTGVTVGYQTLIHGDGPLVMGQGPVRTGITAILPRGSARVEIPCWAGVHSLNGNGEMSGFIWIEESGRQEGPITLTNTHSLGTARDASLKWLVKRGMVPEDVWALPVAAETFDGFLNDCNGFHVHDDHVLAALDGAQSGPLEEGSVGGGTGMMLYQFKGGSGTASRVLEAAGEPVTVGAFVQANFGSRQQLTIAGVPVGRSLGEDMPGASGEVGSIIAVVITDAPLLPHQLKRVARRIGLGVGRSGSVAAHGSGDIFLALSTANEAGLIGKGRPQQVRFLPENDLNPLFEAVIQSVDEAIINALVANETMVGRDGHRVVAMPHGPVRELLRRHGRLIEPG